MAWTLSTNFGDIHPGVLGILCWLLLVSAHLFLVGWGTPVSTTDSDDSDSGDMSGDVQSAQKRARKAKECRERIFLKASSLVWDSIEERFVEAKKDR